MYCMHRRKNSKFSLCSLKPRMREGAIALAKYVNLLRLPLEKPKKARKRLNALLSKTGCKG